MIDVLTTESRSPETDRAELARLIVRVLAETGPMQARELKHRIEAAVGYYGIFQRTIKDSLKYDLRGEVIKRDGVWSLRGDCR